MNTPERRFLHLDNVEADLIIGPIRTLVLLVIIIGCGFFFGFIVGGRIEHAKGHAIGIEKCKVDLDTAIKEGKEFVFTEGKGRVRYRLISIYEAPLTSF